MAWNPGQQLFGSRYIIERKLGEGGIGITYLAKNRRGELRVIKTLREQILNHPQWIPHQDKLRHDFRDEALRLALCRHPHIVQVENVFDEDNLPCMAMEYIEGEDLGKRITEKGALPEGEALQYIRQIGEALILVHEKGLLHRDLKPSNIMMRAGKPEAVLIDFGLARQFLPGGVQRHTESLTPGYAPPEQYIPDAERGEYIDVYALAATLYSLLTGQLPMPVPVRLQNFTLQAPKELNSSVSDRVNNAIMRGMALNYRLRPQSVQEWLDLLGFAGHFHQVDPVAFSPDEEILASGSKQTKTIKVFTNFAKNIEKYLQRLTDAWQVSNGREILTIYSSGNINSIAISPDGKTIASGSSSDKVNIWDLNTGELLRSLKGHHVAFNPDGQTLATNLHPFSDEIGIWHCSTGERVRTLNSLGYAYLEFPIAISPNGQFLATSINRTFCIADLANHLSEEYLIYIWNLTTGEVIHGMAGHFDIVNHVAFSPDSQILVSGSNDGAIKLWSVRTGELIRTLNEDALERYKLSLRAYAENPYANRHFSIVESIQSITFNPQGNILASSSGNVINLWNPTTGQLIRTLSGHSDRVHSIAFSSDGQILASASSDKTIKLWEVQTGKKICNLTHSHSVKSVAFSPDGSRLAAGDNGGNIKIWRRS